MTKHDNLTNIGESAQGEKAKLERDEDKWGKDEEHQECDTHILSYFQL